MVSSSSSRLVLNNAKSLGSEDWESQHEVITTPSGGGGVRRSTFNLQKSQAWSCAQASTGNEWDDDPPVADALSRDDLPNAEEIKAMPFERQWRKVILCLSLLDEYHSHFKPVDRIPTSLITNGMSIPSPHGDRTIFFHPWFFYCKTMLAADHVVYWQCWI